MGSELEAGSRELAARAGLKVRWFLLDSISRDEVPAGYWIAIVRSYPDEEGYWTHARVMRGRRIAHDPAEIARSRPRRYLLGFEVFAEPAPS